MRRQDVSSLGRATTKNACDELEAAKSSKDDLNIREKIFLQTTGNKKTAIRRNIETEKDAI